MLALVAHVAAAGALATLPLPRPVPDTAAQIEIMIGTDARETGASPPPVLPPNPAPQLAAPPSPAFLSPQPASSPAQPAEATAPPLPRPPPAASAEAQPPASVAPEPEHGAKAASPVAAQPTAAIPLLASAAPAPPPEETVQGSAVARVPDIRIGDGIAAAAAEIEGAGLVHPATSQVGNVPPEYPVEAARRRERGTVVLRISIAADGSVNGVTVVRSSGSADLDRAARDRIATWHFDPARRDGVAVPDVEEQSIRFLPE